MYGARWNVKTCIRYFVPTYMISLRHNRVLTKVKNQGVRTTNFLWYKKEIKSKKDLGEVIVAQMLLYFNKVDTSFYRFGKMVSLYKNRMKKTLKTLCQLSIKALRSSIKSNGLFSTIVIMQTQSLYILRYYCTRFNQQNGYIFRLIAACSQQTACGRSST